MTPSPVGLFAALFAAVAVVLLRWLLLASLAVVSMAEGRPVEASACNAFVLPARDTGAVAWPVPTAELLVMRCDPGGRTTVAAVGDAGTAWNVVESSDRGAVRLM